MSYLLKFKCILNRKIGLLRNLLRDLSAVFVVSIFLFPIFWLLLISIKPVDAIFEYKDIIWFDFSPTFFNYEQTIFNKKTEYLSSRYALFASLIVALGSTFITISFAIPAAFALSRYSLRSIRTIFIFLFFQRFVPSIVIIVPLVFFYHQLNLYDSLFGLILAHAAMSLPFVILFIKSFIDEISLEIREAAIIDGATALGTFFYIYIPIIRNSILVAAMLCFIFSWTEFVFGLFLTSSNRTLPIQMALSMNKSWGFTSAIGVISLIPVFILVLFSQRYLIRGFTMGLNK